MAEIGDLLKDFRPLRPPRPLAPEEIEATAAIEEINTTLRAIASPLMEQLVEHFPLVEFDEAGVLGPISVVEKPAIILRADPEPVNGFVALMPDDIYSFMLFRKPGKRRHPNPNYPMLVTKNTEPNRWLIYGKEAVRGLCLLREGALPQASRTPSPKQ